MFVKPDSSFSTILYEVLPRQYVKLGWLFKQKNYTALR